MRTQLARKVKFSPVDIEARQKLDFGSGDTVKVVSRIVDEKGKSRTQAFEGVVLARKHGTEPGATFTIRKVASGVGVERIFPLYSPIIEKIEITKKSRSRRSKLYYIRDKAVKDVRKKLRTTTVLAEETPEEEGEIEVNETPEESKSEETEKEAVSEESEEKVSGK